MLLVTCLGVIPMVQGQSTALSHCESTWPFLPSLPVMYVCLASYVITDQYHAIAYGSIVLYGLEPVQFTNGILIVNGETIATAVPNAMLNQNGVMQPEMGVLSLSPYQSVWVSILITTTIPVNIVVQQIFANNYAGGTFVLYGSAKDIWGNWSQKTWTQTIPAIP